MLCNVIESVDLKSKNCGYFYESDKKILKTFRQYKIDVALTVLEPVIY